MSRPMNISHQPTPDEPESEPERDACVAIDPIGFHLRPPPAPHALTSFLTPDSALFQTIHMGAAVVDSQRWQLRIDGAVAQPFTLTLPQLRALPRTTVTAVHECYGSPLVPPTRFVRRVGNVAWTGVRVSTLLARAGGLPVASSTPAAVAAAIAPTGDDRNGYYLWSDGLDAGTFGGVCADRYRKDLPLAKACADEVLVAYEINGHALDKERGGPVRLVVPGWFGTNSTKWLCRLSVQKGRAKGPFTTRFYNEQVPDAPKGTLRPVWGIEPSSIIVVPEPGARVKGSELEIWGWAWSEDGIAEVSVSIDGSETSHKTELVARTGFEWQRFRLAVALESGSHIVMACAKSQAGMRQPLVGRRNCVHRVQFCVA